MKTRKQRSSWLLKFIFTSVIPLVAWMSFIFVLSNRQKIAFTDNYPLSFSIFKSLHMIEYGILFLLFMRFFHFLKFKSLFFLALIFTFAYGLSDELHQSFVIGREGKLIDASIDALGGVLTWFVFQKIPLLKKIVLSI